ncbi:MAG TPA: hypothetical protein VN428_23010 [Bryobacteraceae bacterium]|nr:hypothetical protein [Bryobacteraceae bacterium]
MLRTLPIVVCLAVVAAFCDAPFVHFHEHATTEHARSAHDGVGLAGHTHPVSPAGNSAIAGPALQAGRGADDDAVFLTWLQSTPHVKPVVIVFQQVAPVLTPDFVVVASVMVPATQSHDPPHLSSIRPRSPPFNLPSFCA